jgi:hypothetical protein
MAIAKAARLEMCIDFFYVVRQIEPRRLYVDCPHALLPSAFTVDYE